MDTKKDIYKKLFKIIIPLAIVALWALYSSFPKKKDLIMTPSSHQEVEYLLVENPKLTDKFRIKFALYDVECNYGQICISVPKNDRTLSPRDTYLFIDDVPVERYSIITHSTFWRDYIILLFKDMPDWNEMVLEYAGQVARIIR